MGPAAGGGTSPTIFPAGGGGAAAATAKTAANTCKIYNNEINLEGNFLEKDWLRVP